MYLCVREVREAEVHSDAIRGKESASPESVLKGRGWLFFFSHSLRLIRCSLSRTFCPLCPALSPTPTFSFLLSHTILLNRYIICFLRFFNKMTHNFNLATDNIFININMLSYQVIQYGGMKKE